LKDFPEILGLGSEPNKRPTKEEFEKPKEKGNHLNGYCIRTGIKIPFNPKRPFSEQAYKAWAYYGNPDFQETFCHKTGERSKGQTSMNNPIMRINR
jgi:hypothetical protein